MKLTVLGAGSWGLTLTWLLARNFENVTLWARNPEVVNEMKRTRRTEKPVAIRLDNYINITDNMKEAIEDTDIVLLAVATSGIRQVCGELRELGLSKDAIIVNTSKGIEIPGLYRMSEVIAQELPHNRICVLSGPTLAKEVVRGLPTAATVASECIETANLVQQKFSVPKMFRTYTNTDVAGVELGGSLKNVIAIASGFVDAMELGANAKGSILTRGLAEIVRISMELGANPSTLYGLSGIGDLIATCSSPFSRNYQVGYKLGQGKKLDAILEELGEVAEGVKTAKAVCELANKLNIEMPVSNIVYEAVYTNISPDQVILKLMSRQLKGEDTYKLTQTK